MQRNTQPHRPGPLVRLHPLYSGPVLASNRRVAGPRRGPRPTDVVDAGAWESCGPFLPGTPGQSLPETITRRMKRRMA